jgi:hypothetical protein
MLHVNPSAIDWRENSDGVLIAFEDSKPLDTKNDPILSELKIHQETLLIIGLGSGFILEEVLKKKAAKRIIVIECRDGLMARQIKRYPEVEFHLLQSWQDFESAPQLGFWMKPDVQKILNKPALGQQSQFFQEVFYFLNLRTRKSLEKMVNFKFTLDDRWLVNLSQFFQAQPTQVLEYPKTHTLILQELTK